MTAQGFTNVKLPNGKLLEKPGPCRPYRVIRNDPACLAMRILATVLLIVSLLATGGAMAGADITRPACSAQFRADNQCHAPILPGTVAEPAKKPGICLLCLIPSGSMAIAAHPGTRLTAGIGRTVPASAPWTLPWRPPRI